MATENIVKGQFYRILADKANDIWDRISYWTHSDDVEMNDGSTLTANIANKNAEINNLFTDLAPMESSSSASQAYVKGQCLIYNNQMYRVTAAIATGDTLTVGTNIETMTAGELSTMLTTSTGDEFYFDCQDGKYGFNTDPSRDVSTFLPFGSSTAKRIATGLSGTRTVNVSTLYDDYASLTADNFVVEYRSSSAHVGAGNYYSDIDGYASVSKNYNPQTGSLTITYSSSRVTTGMSYNLWVCIQEE